MVKYAEDRVYLLPTPPVNTWTPYHKGLLMNTCVSLALDSEVLSPHSIPFPSLGWNAIRVP